MVSMHYNYKFFTVGLVINSFRCILCILLPDISEIERTCLRVADNDMFHSVFIPPPGGNCSGWFCWESHLTLDSKVRIVLIVNQFRNTQAKNISNMNQLIWHWALEEEAIRASETCQRRYLEVYDIRRNIEGLGFSLLCENGCMIKRLTQNPTQFLFVSILRKFLLNNFLQDFDKKGQFRRANALFFGCALVVRNVLTESGNYEDVYHFVCVYCTTENEMKSIYKKDANDDTKCPPSTVYGGDEQYPHLCQHKSLVDIYMCAPENPCINERKKIPQFWMVSDPGIINELIMLEMNTGPTLLVNVTTVGPLNTAGVPSSVTSDLHFDEEGYYLAILSHYPPIPKFVYKYSPKVLKFYNEKIAMISKSKLEAIEPSISKQPVKYIPGNAIEGSEDAWCCGIMFLLSCIPSLVLVILIFYTCKQSWLRPTR